MKFALSTVIALAAIAGGTSAYAQGAHPLKGAELAPMAHVTLADARAVGLKARPGSIVDQELEKESGGSGLRYSFDIKSAGKIYEVGVDAKTGRVLENGVEGKHSD